MKTILCWLAALALVSCTAADDGIAYSEPENYTVDTVVRTYTLDYTARFTSGSDLLTFRGETWVLTNVCGAGKLVFMNLVKDSVIELKLENPDCLKVHTAMKAEGIYVILSDGDVLLYPTGSAIPQRQLNLFTDVKGFRESGMTPEWFKPGSDQHTNSASDELFFRVNQRYEDSSGIYSRYTVGFPVTAKLNLRTREVSFFGSMPHYVTNGSYGHLSHLYDLYSGDSIFYSTPINGTVIILNTRTGKVAELNRPSSYQQRPIEEFRYLPGKDPAMQRDRKTDHGTYSAQYEPLFYNPYDGHYYRIFHPELLKYAENGLLHTEFDKQNILMIFDHNLALTEEIVLPFKAKRTSRLRPVKNGVELILPDLHTIDRSHITYQLLRISRKRP